jgi:transcription-repair coupling factor (superfamily II helicase)
VKAIIEDLRDRIARRQQILFVLPTAGKIDRLQEIFTEYEIPFAHQTDAQAPSRSDSAGSQEAVLVARGEMAEGVVFPDLRLAVLTDSDLFGSFVWGTRGRREKTGISSFISDLSDLKVGDYVVHVDHRMKRSFMSRSSGWTWWRNIDRVAMA